MGGASVALASSITDSGYPAKRTVVSSLPDQPSSHQSNGSGSRRRAAMHQAQRGVDMARGIER
jgi:hypothetical protein